MQNSCLKTSAWWSRSSHFVENGYPSLRFPNMVKTNIHEHWTRVTRFNPLWVSGSILKSSSTITLEIPFHQRNKCRSENETIVNLRNRTEEKRRRQTLCDNPSKPLKLHIPLNTFFVAEPLMLSEFPIKHASLSHSSVLPSSSFCRPVA